MYSAHPNGQVYLHSNNLPVDEDRRIMIVLQPGYELRAFSAGPFDRAPDTG